jgi:hypothetical protein
VKKILENNSVLKNNCGILVFTNNIEERDITNSSSTTITYYKLVTQLS